MDVFRANEIIWYGLDFSKAKMIGSDGFKNPSELKSKLFNVLNNEICTNTDKFDLKSVFVKDKVINDLSLTDKLNESIDVTNIVTDNNYYAIQPDEIDGIVKNYNTKAKEGIGLVFIIESFDKTSATCNLYVTFFDISTKKVLLKERMDGHAGGAGIKSFWFNSLYNIFKEIENKKYNKWREKAIKG